MEEKTNQEHAFTGLEKSILQTMAYYNAVGNRALTSVEIKKYLFKSRNNVRLSSIEKSLLSLKEKGFIGVFNGFWTISEEPKNAFYHRIDGGKESLLKWRITKKTATFLAYTPYTRFIAVTGSVALSRSNKNSDIDILVISSKNKIWLTRFLITIISFILRRRRYGTKTTNRLCFNHYMTENSSTLGPPLVHKVVNDIKTPIWALNRNLTLESIYALDTNRILIKTKLIIEKIFNITKISTILEALLGKVQLKKIRNNPLGYPKELPRPSIDSTNIIFYYPKVKRAKTQYESTLIKTLDIRTLGQLVDN